MALFAKQLYNPKYRYKVGLLIPNTAHTSSTVCALLSYIVFNAATRSGFNFNFLPPFLPLARAASRPAFVRSLILTD